MSTYTTKCQHQTVSVVYHLRILHQNSAPSTPFQCGQICPARIDAFEGLKLSPSDRIRSFPFLQAQAWFKSRRSGMCSARFLRT